MSQKDTKEREGIDDIKCKRMCNTCFISGYDTRHRWQACLSPMIGAWHTGTNTKPQQNTIDFL